MKALSLTQPWLEMILHHDKRIENRLAWKSCPYRGPILLHAAKSVGSRADFDDTVENILDIVKPTAGEERITFLKPFAECRIGGRGIHHASGWWAPTDGLKRGGIVGRAQIVDVIKAPPEAMPEVTFDEWVERSLFAECPNEAVKRRAQRKWWFGGFALVLDNVEPLPFVPWKGALGLFDVPDDYAARAA